jgi:hypothetical protein
VIMSDDNRAPSPHNLLPEEHPQHLAQILSQRRNLNPLNPRALDSRTTIKSLVYR